MNWIRHKNKTTGKAPIAVKRMLRQALCLDKTVVESIESEGDGVVVRVRPHERSRRRCPVCGRRCPGYDRGRGARRWRTVDLGSSRCFLEYAPVRVRCPKTSISRNPVPLPSRSSQHAAPLASTRAVPPPPPTIWGISSSSHLSIGSLAYLFLIGFSSIFP